MVESTFCEGTRTLCSPFLLALLALRYSLSVERKGLSAELPPRGSLLPKQNVRPLSLPCWDSVQT